MGSRGIEHKLPVIDLSNEDLKPGTETWLMACKEVQHALEEYGCFEAVYHKVPLELHHSIFSVMEDLFNLPIETKSQKISEKPFFNYLQYSCLPLYESLGIHNATTLEGARGFTTMMWPEGNDHFSETAHSFSKLMAELHEMVTRMVFDSYGVQRLYESHMASTIYRFRCFKYRKPQVNESNMGMLPHRDPTFTSIFHQNQVGLQIKTKDGQWITVQPSPSSFLFMASEAFMAWSNDRIRACEHQVILKEKKDRYSLGLFSYDTTGMLQVPEELADDKYPLLYTPFDHIDYLHFFQAPEAKKLEFPIKAYCGV